MGLGNICGACPRNRIGIMVAVILLLAGGAGAATWTVDDSGGANYTRIQDAIDNARAGDTILVYSGTYNENVDVSKQLVLRGVDNGGGKPVVDAKGNGDAITLSIGKSTLEGFTVVNSGNVPEKAGIRVSSNDNLIKNNFASNNFNGIYLPYSNNKLIGNDAISNGRGIYLDASSNNTLYGNRANFNNGGGIVLASFSNNNNLSGNYALNNYNGIWLSYSNNNKIYNNFFNNNQNVFTYSTSSTWNTSKTLGTNIIDGPYFGGNVWANPSGTGFSQMCVDTDKDGICDSPYMLLDGGNIDYLPLAYNPVISNESPPLLTFAGQTPLNRSTINQKWVVIEIFSNKSLNAALLQWNGINESMCCSGTSWNKRKISLANGTHAFRVWGVDFHGNWNSTEMRVIAVSAPPSDGVVGGGSGNGSIASGPMTWTASNFPAFWHEDGISGEMLAVLQPDLSSSQRIINKMNLIYNTTGKRIPYKVYTETGLTVDYGLECQYGSGSGCYAKVGWLGKPYVAVQGKANKLAEIVLEQNSTESRSLAAGATWNMGNNYSLKLNSIDAKVPPRLAQLIFNKSSTKLDDKVIQEGDVYTFYRNLEGESNVPLFVTYVDNITENSITLKYTWLISDNVTIFNAGNRFGLMELVSGGSFGFELRNSDSSVTLSRNTMINFMDGLYLVVNDSSSLAYYPMLTTPTSALPSSLSISINNGDAYTNSTSVTLSVSAVNEKNMSFSNDSISWSASVPFAATKSWNLTSGDGLKTVYFKARNDAGESAHVNDTIILDTTPPSVNITSPANDSYVKVPVLSFIGNATDSNGMKSVCIGQTSGAGGGGVGGIGCRGLGNIITSIAFNHSIILQEGRNSIKIIYVDVADNYGSAMVNLTLDSIQPYVANLSLSTSTPRMNRSVNITVNVSDIHLDNSSIFVTIKTKSFTNTSPMVHLGNGSYYYNFTNTSEYGRYNVTINASDLAGNIKSVETWFVTVKTSSTNTRLNGGKGQTATGSWEWNSMNFLDFVHNETLKASVMGRLIPVEGLWYNTSREINLNFVSRNMTVGETWNFSEGYSIFISSADSNSTPRQVWFRLYKNEQPIDEKPIPEGEQYVLNYGVENPLFITADNIFAGPIAQMRLGWITSDKLVKIGDKFGILTVRKNVTNGLTQYLNMTNDASTNLTRGNSTKIMGDLYFRVLDTENLSYYPYFNRPKEAKKIEMLDNDLSLDISVNETISGKVNLTQMTDVPPDMNLITGFKSLNKFIDIDVSDDISKNLEWVKIKIYYTQAELDASGVTEANLKVLWYNGSSWIDVTGGYDPTNVGNFTGHVWANMTHLSTFALAGHIPASNGGNPPSSSGGGGGGGGGGTSGENYSNIILKEKYDEAIYKDKPTSYKFKNASNPVIFINITGNINAGLITTVVEVLKGTSTLVKEDAPGIVNRNFNIWVGTSGFSTSKNIKEATVMFRVENSWIEGNALARSEIKLVKWDNGTWKILETSEKNRDGTYTYFEGKTTSFSPFAVTGIKEAAPTATLPGVTASADTTSAATSEGAQPTNLAIILVVIVLIAVIGMGVAVYMKRK